MAVGTVSSVSGDIWQLIATNTTTSGTTTTFSGLSGYKKYMAVFNITQSAGDTFYCRINGSTANKDYNGFFVTAGSSRANYNFGGFNLTVSTAQTSKDGSFIITDADKSVPKNVEALGDYYMGYGKGVWNNTDAITSIVFGNSTATFTAGTIALYGIAS